MIHFGTKAETLEAIRNRVIKSKICPSLVFTVAEWQLNPSKFLQLAGDQFKYERVIVRSSAIGEDSEIWAMAGVHDSIANIPVDDQDVFKKAVDQVIASYLKCHEPSGNKNIQLNQILIQPMVIDISMSGVIFTQDLDTGGPYYVINYDDETGLTDTVTSGKSDKSRTLLIHRNAIENLQSERFSSLLDAVVEIEEITKTIELDIEFAVTTSNQIFIFQVRRLTVQNNWSQDVAHSVNESINEVEIFLDQRLRRSVGALGKTSIFTEMSDWNPAEMIGATPTRLSASLYRYLITDGVWASARAEMGYRDQSDRSLMVFFGGRPFIDVRESFNSFLPAALPDAIGEKIVNHWIDVLKANPDRHDKVEFEVASTVWSFDFEKMTRPSLVGAGLSQQEIDVYSQALFKLTDQVISTNHHDLLAVQESCLEELHVRRQSVLSEFDGSVFPLHTAKQLLVDCRLLGTKAFAVMARCAFISEELLRSMVRLGILDSERAQAFRGSIKTVLSEFLSKTRDLQLGLINEQEFFSVYGHLRPGTYNIMSKRYDQQSELFSNVKTNIVDPSPELKGSHSSFKFTVSEMNSMDRLLSQLGFSFSAQNLVEFMGRSIAGREAAKLKFTRNLSDALEFIAAWGEKFEVSRENLAHIAIFDLFDTLIASPYQSTKKHLLKLSKLGVGAFCLTRAIKLPYLIAEISDIHVIPLLKSRPNFITNKSICSKAVLISGQEIQDIQLEGKIVLIESADPGFDWLFMNPIAGLITKYGGVNSHMAIRCAELGISAAIGCGEQLFDQLARADEILLDCGAGMVIKV